MPRKLFVLLSALLLILVGCGGSDGDDSGADGSDEGSSETLTKAEFIAAGDDLCSAADDEIDAIAAPESVEDLDAFLESSVAVIRDTRDGFADLEPPSDGEDLHEAYLEFLDMGIEAAEQSRAAFAEGNEAEGQRILEDLGTLQDPVHADLRAYGFEQCGEAPTEEGDPAEGDPEEPATETTEPVEE